jgi:hypothetical protein
MHIAYILLVASTPRAYQDFAERYHLQVANVGERQK